ncbi:unnamed protein product [Mycena citricolor]|uniref:Uncharacterized protein n=1 Tax=Mycena citricolor TaxID=2018698 RepID=A0AAD2HSP0_9AGAR|nr:unnamed protein product [Mycena citricolor]
MARIKHRRHSGGTRSYEHILRDDPPSSQTYQDAKRLKMYTEIHLPSYNAMESQFLSASTPSQRLDFAYELVDLMHLLSDHPDEDIGREWRERAEQLEAIIEDTESAFHGGGGPSHDAGAGAAKKQKSGKKKNKGKNKKTQGEPTSPPTGHKPDDTLPDRLADDHDHNDNHDQDHERDLKHDRDPDPDPDHDHDHDHDHETHAHTHAYTHTHTHTNTQTHTRTPSHDDDSHDQSGAPPEPRERTWGEYVGASILFVVLVVLSLASFYCLVWFGKSLGPSPFEWDNPHPGIHLLPILSQSHIFRRQPTHCAVQGEMRVETLRRQLVLVLAAAPRSDVSLYMALWSGHRLGASADDFGWHAQLPDDTGRRRGGCGRPSLSLLHSGLFLPHLSTHATTEAVPRAALPLVAGC